MEEQENIIVKMRLDFDKKRLNKASYDLLLSAYMRLLNNVKNGNANEILDYLGVSPIAKKSNNFCLICSGSFGNYALVVDCKCMDCALRAYEWCINIRDNFIGNFSWLSDKNCEILLLIDLFSKDYNASVNSYAYDLRKNINCALIPVKLGEIKDNDYGSIGCNSIIKAKSVIERIQLNKIINNNQKVGSQLELAIKSL